MDPNSTLGDASVEQYAQKLADYKVGGLDKRGRRVLDILWSTKDFVIFLHAKGISPHFSDDAALSREQARRYMRLGSVISRLNALLPPPQPDGDANPRTEALPRGNAQAKSHPVRRGWDFFHTPDAFLYRETARAIANALMGERDDAIKILAFVEDRLIARRRVEGQIQYLRACTGMLVIIMLVAGLIELGLRPPQVNHCLES